MYLIENDILIKIKNFDGRSIYFMDGNISPIQKNQIIFGTKEYNHILFSQNYSKYRNLLKKHNLDISEFI